MCILNEANQCFLMFLGIKYLNETNVIELISRRKGPDPYRDNNELLCALYQVFSTPEALGKSFLKTKKPRSKENLLDLLQLTETHQNITKEKVSTFIKSEFKNYLKFYIIIILIL